MTDPVLIKLLDDLLRAHDNYGGHGNPTTPQVFFDSGYRRCLEDIRQFVRDYSRADAS